MISSSSILTMDDADPQAGTASERPAIGAEAARGSAATGNKQQRIRAWEDTQTRMYFLSPEPTRARMHRLHPAPTPAMFSEVRFMEMDCIDCAALLLEEIESTGILNMASARTPGGGVSRGCRAQEEELCRRSNLMVALRQDSHEYPLHGKVLVHHQVTFFKKGATENYRRVARESQLKLTVFTSPAVQLRDSTLFVGGWEAEMERRVDVLLTAVEESGVQAAVLGAWGCGAFGLDAARVAKLFKNRLATCRTPVICFAILNDHNGQQNYEDFSAAFTSRKRCRQCNSTAVQCS